jgi:prolipoprotein diacylglyceryl transferase
MKTFIPTPSSSTLELGFFTIHYYALCILLGIVVAIWITKKRYQALGGDPNDVSDLAIYAIPSGIIGGRIYHVLTSPQKYFGEGGSPVAVLKIWEGGLGIWGAIALGALVAFIYFKKKSVSLTFANFLDSIAPALLLAQAIGRFGNWFNGELFGRPTEVLWALEIPPEKRPTGFENFMTFHPTFLYEAIWCSIVAVFIMRSKFIRKISGTGAVFIFYAASYSFGRLFIEAIRIDDANEILGLRLNIWVSAAIFIAASTLFLRKLAKIPKK